MALVDSTAIGSDSPSETPVLHVLHEFTIINEQGCKEVAFADDFSSPGKRNLGVVIEKQIFNSLMPGGNKKVTHT